VHGVIWYVFFFLFFLFIYVFGCVFFWLSISFWVGLGWLVLLGKGGRWWFGKVEKARGGWGGGVGDCIYVCVYVRGKNGEEEGK
jgi:hypothetical protein